MSFSPQSPQLISGGIVLLEPGSKTVQRVIALQYNPHTVTRSLQAQWYEAQQGAERSDRLRIKGPPIETIKLEAEIDATDQLETPDSHQTAARFGIQPQLAVLEMLVFPTSAQLEANNELAGAGTLEIVPMEAPLTLFVWNKKRVVPVRITEFSITEEFFDPQLNPMQAKISLGLRVLSVDDLGFSHVGGQYFMNYHKTKEELAKMVAGAGLGSLGLEKLPI
jgi:hypothetical protein